MYVYIYYVCILRRMMVDVLRQKYYAGYTTVDIFWTMYLHGCNQSEPLRELLGPAGTLKELKGLLKSFVDLRGP